MKDRDDSDDMPLDGEAEFSPHERSQVRHILKEKAHERWLWRRTRFLWPILVGIAGAIVASIDYISDHWKP